MSVQDQRWQSLIDQIDSASAKILQNQLKLSNLASNESKDLPTLAVDSVEIEASSLNITRAVEDLLEISRGLKECWVLGQFVDNGINKEQSVEEVETTKQLVDNLSNFKTLHE